MHYDAFKTFYHRWIIFYFVFCLRSPLNGVPLYGVDHSYFYALKGGDLFILTSIQELLLSSSNISSVCSGSVICSAIVFVMELFSPLKFLVVSHLSPTLILYEIFYDYLFTHSLHLFPFLCFFLDSISNSYFLFPYLIFLSLSNPFFTYLL